MPAYWMISNRVAQKSGFGTDRGPLTYWVSDNGPLTVFKNWKRASADDFKNLLVAAANRFPLLDHGEHEEQSHVTFFVHGYNTGWREAAKRYEKFSADLYTGNDSLGLCISFDWPSCGNVLGYLPDRAHARECANDLADLLSQLYDWLINKQ